MSVDDTVTTDKVVRAILGAVEVALRRELERYPLASDREITAELRRRPGGTTITISLDYGERADEEETEGLASEATNE
jgi:hypothetical protein